MSTQNWNLDLKSTYLAFAFYFCPKSEGYGNNYNILNHKLDYYYDSVFSLNFLPTIQNEKSNLLVFWRSSEWEFDYNYYHYCLRQIQVEMGLESIKFGNTHWIWDIVQWFVAGIEGNEIISVHFVKNLTCDFIWWEFGIFHEQNSDNPHSSSESTNILSIFPEMHKSIFNFIPNSKFQLIFFLRKNLFTPRRQFVKNSHNFFSTIFVWIKLQSDEQKLS